MLAVGLYDGTIEILDIISDDQVARVGVSERNTSPGHEPIWAIEWILGIFNYFFFTRRVHNFISFF